MGSKSGGRAFWGMLILSVALNRLRRHLQPRRPFRVWATCLEAAFSLTPSTSRPMGRLSLDAVSLLPAMRRFVGPRQAGWLVWATWPEVLDHSLAYGVSANGLVVAGEARSASGTEGFRWTQAGGTIGLGDLPGGDFYSFGHGVSATVLS